MRLNGSKRGSSVLQVAGCALASYRSVREGRKALAVGSKTLSTGLLRDFRLLFPEEAVVLRERLGRTNWLATRRAQCMSELESETPQKAVQIDEEEEA